MSRPQAITAANLTQEQAQSLIQENPPRESILRPSDQFLPPSIPLYLPDPERNKSADNFYLLATYPIDEKTDGNPVKVPLSLDSYVRPPPLPSVDASPINFQVEQAEKEKTSYSYNNRYDYYFPVEVVYDDKQKYADKELQLMEMQPPIRTNEPNYYDVKPKKVPKKYQPNKKDVNHSKTHGREDGLVPIDNDGLVLDSEHTPFVTSQPVERFAPAPSYRDLTDDDLNIGEYIPKYRQEQNTEALSAQDGTASSTISAAASEHLERKLKQSGESIAKKSIFNKNKSKNKNNNHDDDDEDDDNDDNQSNGSSSEADDQTKDAINSNNQNTWNDAIESDDSIESAKRVEFQMHGFNGPNSYKFGFDTGLG